MQHLVFTLRKAPWSSVDNPTRLACKAGCGPHHHVDVFEDARQHGAPLVIPRQLQSTPYEQGSVVYSPSKALEEAGVIEVYLQHGIQHTVFFHPSLVFHAAQCGETEDFICHYQLFIDAPVAFHLIINVEELSRA